MKNWINTVKMDLAPFADTSADGPRINWSQTRSNTMVGQWTSQGHDLSATFVLGEDGTTPQVEFRDRRLDYRAFLADANVGGISRLAERLVAYHKMHPYVETLAKPQDNNARPSLVAELISQKVDVLPSDFTNVLFLTGEAGSGKTSALKHMTAQRAQRYAAGETSSLFLYVNAQGRALATFDQALSVELDDLRSQLTYDMIAPLVRNDLLIPVVDGFDELLGASYDDSFSSLSRFLATLLGRGQIVACARSAYYEQEFLNRVSKENEENLSWQVDRIEIEDWSRQQRHALVELRCSSEGSSRVESTSKAIETILDSSDLRGVEGKPFFVAKLIDLTIEGRHLDTTQSAFDALVSAYIEREVTEKLLDADRNQLLQAEHLKAILTQIAAEMWILGSRQLPKATIQEVVSVTLDQAHLRGQAQEYLHMRGPVLGFLTSSAGGKRIEFEHELMFSYFLGLAFTEELRSAAQLAWLLPRGDMPPRVAEVAAQRIAADGDIQTTKTVAALCAACQSLDIREDQGRANAGALVMALAAATATVNAWAVHDITIGGGFAWPATFVDATFRRVLFYRTDLTATTFASCSASDVNFINVIVDPKRTRLDIRGIDPAINFVGLRTFPSGDELFVPSRILEALNDCGLSSPANPRSTPIPIPPEAMNFMARFARAFSRTNLVWTDDPDKRWTKIPTWTIVRPILLELGLIVEERRENRGEQRAAIRGRFDVTELMRGTDQPESVPPNIKRFWERVRESLDSQPSASATPQSGESN